MSTVPTVATPDKASEVRENGALSLTLFGPMQVEVHGQPLPRLRSRRALWLLALLALRSRRVVEREWLSGTLWPDVSQSQALANLRPLISELRQALGAAADRLQSPDRHTLLLDLTVSEVDTSLFDAEIATNTPASLERAVALYRGPLLEGCTEEWVGQERLHREQSCLQALQKLGDTALAAGDNASAIRHYQRAVSLDPLWEAARRGWMEALAKGGDRNTALQVYREFIVLLKRDPRATPDAQTTALYQRLRTEARHRSFTLTPPAEPTAPPVDGYLPYPLTELVGREDERLEVVGRLQRSRLVTLTGLGGIGKTRLAIETGRELTAEYSDGVWFVALESLSDSSLIAGQIASTLGIREQTGASMLGTLTKQLRHKRLLLILDNCEHLLAGCAQVAGHLLRECATLRILATSREALGITGETAWAVPPLAVPNPSHLPPGRTTLLRVLTGYESVQLFVERAQAVQKEFTLNADNALTIAQICFQLEGFPLATELAAARVKALSVEHIATRLDDHLTLLTGGSRMALSRQQTLRATLDWSYALLRVSEQILLQRLSVFSGGWTLQAAEQVCAEDGIETEQVLDLLTSLVDKSLVLFEVKPECPEGRYRLLEMVRQYAAERLRAGDRENTIRARHRDFYLARVEEAFHQLEKWLPFLETEHNNLRAALAWCAANPEEADAHLRLAAGLGGFWFLRSYLTEGKQHLERALAHPNAQEPTLNRAKALQRAGALSNALGDVETSLAQCEESLRIHRHLNNKPGIASSLNGLGNSAAIQGAFQKAQSLYQESLTIFRELESLPGVAWSLNCMGRVTYLLGDLAYAHILCAESLQIRRELGGQESIAASLHSLACINRLRGDYALAQEQFEESRQLCQTLEDKKGIAVSLSSLGSLAFLQSDDARAQSLYEESLHLFEELGSKDNIAWCLQGLGNIALEQNDFVRAKTHYDTGLRLLEELKETRGIAWLRHSLGHLQAVQDAPANALALYQQSLSLFHQIQDKEGIIDNLFEIATLWHTQNLTLSAVRLWAATHTHRSALPFPLPPRTALAYEQHLAAARQSLGEEAFTAAWVDGCVLTWEEAIGMAQEQAL
jgi:predicted ATPase/DNA-binding SARP family transcriptional activator